MASRLRPMSSGGLTTVVKRPLVVLYLVYIYIKILTSLVNITLSQSVRAVWRGVHPTVRAWDLSANQLWSVSRFLVFPTCGSSVAVK